MMDESAERNFGRAVALEMARAAALEPPAAATLPPRATITRPTRTTNASPAAAATDEQLLAEFHRDQKLQAEFKRADLYVAYAKAAAAGKVRTAPASVICGRPAADR
jgi:hypothetical protein